MKRVLALAMMVAATTVALPSSAAAAGTATCDYWASDKTVRIALTGDVGPYLARDNNGHIMLNAVWCDATATVTNTDAIIVTGDGESQAIEIDLWFGGFKPGRPTRPASRTRSRSPSTWAVARSIIW